MNQKLQRSLKNKTATVFWLRKHINEIKNRAEAPSKEVMQHEGIKHSEQQRRLFEAARRKAECAPQLEALEDLLSLIEEL